MATVQLTPAAQAEFSLLPKAMRARVLAVFERLQAWPEVSGAKPLRGALAGHWRIRTGDYRVQFYIEPGEPAQGDEPAAPDTVRVEKVGHRDGFYD